MKKFVQSGGAFMLVALLCIGAALLSDHKGALVGIGAFWLIMAIIVRGNYAKKQKNTEKSVSGRDSDLK